MEQPAPYINVHSHHVQVPDGEQVVLYSHKLHEHLPSKVGQEVCFTAGLHPWHVRDFDLSNLQDHLVGCLEYQHFLGVGEIGLDKVNGSDMESQQAAFVQQVEWAEHHQLPVVIHNVKADGELMALRKQYSQTKWIIHGFRGNAQQAAHWLDKGCYLSIGTDVFRRSSKLKEVIPSIPFQQLFVETDEVPVDKIAGIYEKIAQLKETSIERLRKEVYNNFIKVFIDE